MHAPSAQNFRVSCFRRSNLIILTLRRSPVKTTRKFYVVTSFRKLGQEHHGDIDFKINMERKKKKRKSSSNSP